MAGQIHPHKEKFTYGEWISVLDEIRKAAREEGLNEAEMLRKITLTYINDRLKQKRKAPLKVDYRSNGHKTNGHNGHSFKPATLARR